jgi:hypothetical protein
MNEKQKLMCPDYKCGWHGMSDEILRATNPFIEGEEMFACPNCFEIGQLRVACDEPGCWAESTCGTPTNDDKYRRTCGKHYPKNPKDYSTILGLPQPPKTE